MDRLPGREGRNRKPERLASASVRGRRGRASALAKLRRRSRTCTGALGPRRRGNRPMSRPRAGSAGCPGLAPSRPPPTGRAQRRSGDKHSARAAPRCERSRRRLRDSRPSASRCRRTGTGRSSGRASAGRPAGPPYSTVRRKPKGVKIERPTPPQRDAPPAFVQAAMPPWMCRTEASPLSWAACTAMADRSPKAQ